MGAQWDKPRREEARREVESIAASVALLLQRLHEPPPEYDERAYLPVVLQQQS